MNYTGKKTRRDGTPWIAVPLPAPGRLETLQAFLNTSQPVSEVDELADPRDLARWLSHRGLLSAGTRLLEEDRQRAIEVRHGLRALLRGNSGAKLTPKAVQRLARAARGARFQVRFGDDGSMSYEPVSEGVDKALGSLLEIAVASQHEGNWPRLKVCRRGSCGRVFYDTSRGMIGKWCTRRCGAAARAEAFRQTRMYKRQKARERQGNSRVRQAVEALKFDDEIDRL